MAAKLFLPNKILFRRHLRTFCSSRSRNATSRILNQNLSVQAYSDRCTEPENFDTLGTWDNRIDLPLLLQASIKHGKPIPKISIENVGTASVIGRRTTNEDRYRVKELKSELLYFAVYDGHGGPECADFCSEHMEDNILYWLARGERDLQTILQFSFQEVNNAYARHIIFNCPRNDATTSGTTATVCLLRNSVELVVGHVGDSRALLCRNGETKRLTTDHTADLKSEKGLIKTVWLNIEKLISRESDIGPSSRSKNILPQNSSKNRIFLLIEEEGLASDSFEMHTFSIKQFKERILKSSGMIKADNLGRHLVNGRLAMTRSLGDLDLKPYGVTAQPDTRSLEVKHGRDAFLILTTDGVNFAMSDQEICDAVNTCHDPREGAGFVTDQALQFGSEDNATTVIVPFGAWGKYQNHKKIALNFGRSLLRSNRY